jgi:hypothetical protein
MKLHNPLHRGFKSEGCTNISARELFRGLAKESFRGGVRREGSVAATAESCYFWEGRRFSDKVGGCG